MLMKYLWLAILPWMGIQDSVRFRVAVEAVQVDVWVGRDGKAIAGLTEDDFALFEGGFARKSHSWTPSRDR